MTQARDKANIPVLNFASKGIDDNATSTALTITSGADVQIGSTNSGVSGTIDLSIGNTSSSGGITLWSTTSASHSIGFADGYTGTDRYRGYLEYTHNGDSMRFGTASSERMRLTSTGLGIGTTSPTVALEVYGAVKFNESPGASSGNVIIDGSATGNPQLRYYQNGTAKGYLTYWDSSDTLALTDGSANGLHFKPSNGRVGIGTSAPSTPLQVTKSALSGFVARTASTLTLESSGGTEIYLASPDSSYGQIRFGDTASTYSGGIQYEHNANHMLFQINAAERMRIDASGRLLVGATSAPGNEQNGFVSSDPTLGLYRTSSTTSGAIVRMYSDVGGTKTVTVQIENDGDINNTNNSYGALSDRNLKENEVDASSQWNDIKSIQVKNYNLKSLPEMTHLGVIAQDLEASGMNGLVKTNDEGTKSVKYSILYMKSVKALQEAIERIETLEAKVQTLENNQP